MKSNRLKTIAEKFSFGTLLKRLNIGGRDITVFLLSLLLAFSIWLIHNLSENYSDTMSVTVVAECNIEGHSNVSSNSSTIAARCRTSGFSLLRNRHQAKRDAVHIKFATKDLKLKEGEIYYITASELGNYVNDIFGDGVRLEAFLSDQVQFRFPYENNKRVPVVANPILSFKPQYMAMGPIHLQPDSVTVYGEPFHLDNIHSVATKTISLPNLHSSAHGSVKLETISKVRMSDTEVNYSLDVTRYVEIPDEVVVTMRNVPSGKKVKVLPATAKVLYKCAFPLSSDPKGKVHFYIDYKDFLKSAEGKCIAVPTQIPEGVIEYTTSPEIFECVEEGKQ